MCNMAAYVGQQQAAPELIKMLQLQEGLAGGHYTGIATLHEGKIYMAKVCGDCQELLKRTDALKLPGTVGIAHSRTPGIPLDNWAQPFLSSDGQTVFCSNGIGPNGVLPDRADFMREMADKLIQAGFSFNTGVPDELPAYIKLNDNLTYHTTEIAGTIVSYYNRSMPLAEALIREFSEIPNQVASLAMSVREPDKVFALRYNQSLFYGRKDWACCLATSGTALQELDFKWIAPVPAGSVSTLSQNGIEVLGMDCFIDKLTVLPDLQNIWKFLDSYFADGQAHGVIDAYDELVKHPELDPPGMVAQDSFAIYTYLMEKLRRGELRQGVRQVPGSMPGSMRSETTFELP